jgi:DNA-binding NarL/FixJ family response regulator
MSLIKTLAAPATIRVVLADDHDLVRSGLAALLGQAGDIEVIGEARDGEELLAVLTSLVPDVVVTDISMPVLDGLGALARIRERHPGLPVIVLSMYDTVDFVRRAVANGAAGYLMKDSAPQELERAVRAVVQTGSYFGSAVAQLLLRPPEPTASDELTERQIEILKLLAEGRSSKEIAFELGLSAKTVDVHRARIMARLALNDVASLTRYAVRMGLVEA